MFLFQILHYLIILPKILISMWSSCQQMFSSFTICWKMSIKMLNFQRQHYQLLFEISRLKIFWKNSFSPFIIQIVMMANIALYMKKIIQSSICRKCKIYFPKFSTSVLSDVCPLSLPPSSGDWSVQMKNNLIVMHELNQTTRQTQQTLLASSPPKMENLRKDFSFTLNNWMIVLLISISLNL